MGLETNTEVDKIEAVNDRNGDLRPPANADQLGNFGGGVDGEATDNGTGSTLSDNAVPEGVKVLVQAKRGNGSPVKVGLTSSPTISVPAGGSVTYRVENTNQINVVAGTAGDGVNFTAETE